MRGFLRGAMCINQLVRSPAGNPGPAPISSVGRAFHRAAPRDLPSGTRPALPVSALFLAEGPDDAVIRCMAMMPTIPARFRAAWLAGLAVICLSVTTLAQEGPSPGSAVPASPGSAPEARGGHPA